MSNTWLNTVLSPLDPGAIQKVKPHDTRATVRRVPFRRMAARFFRSLPSCPQLAVFAGLVGLDHDRMRVFRDLTNVLDEGLAGNLQILPRRPLALKRLSLPAIVQFPFWLRQRPVRDVPSAMAQHFGTRDVR